MKDILNELTSDVALSSKSKKRVERARNDFKFFCETYLNHYFLDEPAEYQEEIYKIISSGKVEQSNIDIFSKYMKDKYKNLLKVGPVRGIADAEPREHGKSVRMSFAFPLWCILFEKKKMIILIGASSDMAEDNLSNIKTEIEENEEFLEDFGELKGSVWSAKKIVLKNGCCIIAKGSGAHMRGVKNKQHRPDLVICDDILKDDAAESPTQRNKIFRWVKRVVFPLGKNVFIVFINTIFHNDDLICRLLKEISENKLKGFLGLRFSAIINDKPLWQSHWSLKDLQLKKDDLGLSEFNTEYLNEPLSEEDQIFKSSWIKYYEPSSLNLGALKIIQAVDPATGSHDRSAIVTLGCDEKAKLYYVLDAYSKTISPKKFIEEVLKKFTFWQPQKIGWEAVNFQRVFAEYTQEIASQNSIRLPIKELSPKGVKKETRISRLSPLIESGRIFFKDNQKNLIEELLTFPKGTFDDTVDALEYAVSMFSKSKKGQPFVAPIRARR